MGKILAVAVLAVVLFGTCAQRNSLVSKDEDVSEAWANVETAYQRRYDLIPNLVQVAKGSMDFERRTYVETAMARAGAAMQSVEGKSISDLTPEQFQEFQAAQAALTGAIRAIQVTVEAYPQLRSVGNMRELMAEIAGTENRVAVARRDFNERVRLLNTAVRRFPGNIVAGAFGIDRRDLFRADSGAAITPKVDIGR